MEQNTKVISSGKVELIDYKTTFRKKENSNFPEAAVLQLNAYANAFKEYYNYKKPIQLIIVRVYLIYDIVYEDSINENDIGFFNNNDEILTDGWKGKKEIIFKRYYHDSDDFEEVRNIVKKIKNKDFTHNDNPNKCKFCQYNKNCVDTLI